MSPIPATGSGMCSSVSKQVMRSYLPGGGCGEVRNERIVGDGVRESRRPQLRAKRIVAAAVVEHAPLTLVRAEQRHHGGRIVARPRLRILRIDRRITLIIDVGLEVLLAPGVEGVGEQESAAAAAPVTHRRAGRRQLDAALDLAISVEVDGPVERRRLAADLAGDQRGRNRRQTQHRFILSLLRAQSSRDAVFEAAFLNVSSPGLSRRSR